MSERDEMEQDQVNKIKRKIESGAYFTRRVREIIADKFLKEHIQKRGT